MGGCYSVPTTPAAAEGKRKHRQAEQHLKEAKVKLMAQKKVLLLGSGDSGKSTILKQMRILHEVPFSPQEMENYRQQIFNNLTHGLKYVLDALPYLDLTLSDENRPHAELIMNAKDVKDSEPFPASYCEPLRKIWEDPAVRKAWTRRNEAALPENLMYYFGDLNRLFDPSYQPTSQDILQCRVRTTGITETTLKTGKREMLVVDVGGQKSERKKWMHCFEGVTSILFLVNLSGYDQPLVEDRDQNQMMDAMTIWESIVHSRWFKNTSIILFLNKNDLFEERIKRSKIQRYFPDYNGPSGDANAGREYFKRRFTTIAAKNGDRTQRNYVHYTTAINTKTLKAVMTAVEAQFYGLICKMLHSSNHSSDTVL